MRFLTIVLVLSNLACSTPSKSPRSISSESSGMEYVEICRSPGDCKNFSRLIMGTDHLIQGDWSHQGQAEISENEFYDILNEAVKLGINLFDTSPIYVGSVENRLGQWLKGANEALSPEKRVHALSKGGFPFDLYYSKQLEAGSHSESLKNELRKHGILSHEKLGSGPISLVNVPPGTYASRLYGEQAQITERVAEELGHSSTNLHADITIYLMHRDDGDYFKFDEIHRSQTPVKTIMQALSSEPIANKFWMLGWSNWKTNRVNESIQLAKSNTQLSKPILNSPYFSLFEMSQRSIHAGGVQVTHEEMTNQDFQSGIKLMPYSPLGGFSIFDKPEPVWENAKKAAKQKFDQGDPYWQNVYRAIFTKANERRYLRVVDFTKEFNTKNNTNYTLDQMINAYALAHRRTDFLVIGPITIEQLRRSVQSLKLSRMLTAQDLEYLHSGKKAGT